MICIVLIIEVGIMRLLHNKETMTRTQAADVLLAPCMVWDPPIGMRYLSHCSYAAALSTYRCNLTNQISISHTASPFLPTLPKTMDIVTMYSFLKIVLALGEKGITLKLLQLYFFKFVCKCLH